MEGEPMSWESIDEESRKRLEEADSHPHETRKPQSGEDFVAECYARIEDILNSLEIEGENIILTNGKNIVGKNWVVEKVKSTGFWLAKKTSL